MLRWIGLAVLVFCATFASSCSSNPSTSAQPAQEPPSPVEVVSSSSAIEAVKSRGRLRMLCFPHQGSHFVRPNLDRLREVSIPLKEYRDPSGYVGVDVDFMTALANKLEVELEIWPVTTSYRDLIPALLADKADLIASSLTITEERARAVDFSDPYHTIWVSAVLREGLDATSLEQLAGKRAAVMKGSSQLELLRSTDLDLDFVETDFTLQNYEAVKEKRADFTLVDTVVEPGGVVHPLFPKLTAAFRIREIHYGVAVPPGSNLLEPLNALIAEFKETGEFERLQKIHPAIF